MAIDPSIPLSAAQQPSFFQQAGQAYQLAGAIEKQKEQQEMRQDQQTMQQFLKEGGNLATPDGLTAAAEALKGKVSPNAYQTIIKAKEDMQANATQYQTHLAQQQEHVLKGALMQNDLIAQNLNQALTTYDTAKKEKGDQGALQDFEAAKKQIIQGLSSQTGPNGQPLIPPQMLQRFAGMNPAEARSALQSTTWGQEQLKGALELKYKEAQIEYEKERTKALKKGGVGATYGIPEEITKSKLTGKEFLDLLEPGDAANTLAVAEGRKSLNDFPAKQKARIGQYVAQYDPSFSNVRNAADKAAAVAISKDLSAIRPYGEMLDKNADIAVDLAKKAIATDSRLANKSINWLKQNMSDNPDVAEFLAQTTFVQTEAARVLNNPRLVGQLTDTARQEMEHVISGDMPIKSYERVIRRIQTDGRNRIQAMENQRDRILAGTGRPKEIPQSELAKTGESGAVPRGANDILSILKKHGVK